MSITHIPYEDNFDWIEIRKKRILHLLRNVGQPAGEPVYDITPYLVPAFYNRAKAEMEKAYKIAQMKILGPKISTQNA